MAKNARGHTTTHHIDTINTIIIYGVLHTRNVTVCVMDSSYEFVNL